MSNMFRIASNWNQALRKKYASEAIVYRYNDIDTAIAEATIKKHSTPVVNAHGVKIILERWSFQFAVSAITGTPKVGARITWDGIAYRVVEMDGIDRNFFGRYKQDYVIYTRRDN